MYKAKKRFLIGSLAAGNLDREGICVSPHLLELTHWRLGGVRLELTRMLLYLVCVLLRLEGGMYA